LGNGRVIVPSASLTFKPAIIIMSCKQAKQQQEKRETR
jgi:hypothetical protein